MVECPAERRYGDHLYVRIYSRPWRRLFRRTHELRCWHCTWWWSSRDSKRSP